jgi:catechol 2,3-dioxygenase
MNKPIAQNDGAGFFHPRRLCHVNLYVSDLDRSMDFYTKILGIEEVYRTPLAGGGFVSNGNTHHDVGFTLADGPLGKPRNARPGTLSHVAFELETEAALVASYARATEAGASFLRTADHDIAHSVYGLDPDGNCYELYADVVQDWRNRRTGIITKPKPNWSPGSTPPVAEPLYHEHPELRRVESAIFHPLYTSHATLIVADLDAAMAYYRDVIGLAPVWVAQDGTFSVLSGTLGQHALTLVVAGPGRPVGYHHVSMRVRDDADLSASTVMARQNGIPIVADVCATGRRAVTIRDPDGCLTQFFVSETDELRFDGLPADLAPYLL